MGIGHTVHPLGEGWEVFPEERPLHRRNRRVC